MAKSTQVTYVAHITLGAGGAWGSGTSPEKAVENAKREAVGFAKAMGGFSESAEVYINVVRIPIGMYWAYDAREGHVVKDYDTDEVMDWAEPYACHTWLPQQNEIRMSPSRLAAWSRGVADARKAKRLAS